VTTASAQTVTEYLDRVAEPYRADARDLHKLIRATAPELKYLTDSFADRVGLRSTGKAAAEQHAR
jgi:hypothetical protein